jgi:glycosyltransferase involved in cell wall biosynthesis
LASQVTCVVPALDAAPWIEETLRSILAQTHPPVEVIVVDGGSTDGTQELATALDDRIRVAHDPGQSPPASRNRGIREAEADFVAFLDADDLWHPEKLQRQLARFAQRHELDALATLVQNFWDEGHEAEAEHYREHRRMQPIPGYAMNTVLARRSAFLHKVGLLNPSRRFSDGAEWFIRAREAGAEFELMDEVLAYHRLHGTNMSRRHSEAGEEEFLMLVKSVLDRRRGREPA